MVVPQFLGRLDFVGELERLATETAVPFVEVVLLSSAQDVTERFLRRTAESDLMAHRGDRGANRDLTDSNKSSIMAG